MEIKKKFKYRTPQIHLIFAITKKNQHEVGKMREFCKQYNVKADIYYASLNLRFCEQMDQTRKTIEEWAPSELRGVNLPEKRKYYEFIRDHNRIPTTYECCTQPFETMFVNWNGDVCICCVDYRTYVVGSALNQDLKEIWNNPKYVEIRRFIKSKGKTEIDKNVPCKDCFMF